tara:strand:- start:15 stop:176 length:162 start_codon:yes stop_codon:yes gene_type:complete
MNKNLNSRNGSIHLYNPKKEGLGHYDVHYINAHKNKNKPKSHNQIEYNERFVA